jgi:hypothetical protein
VAQDADLGTFIADHFGQGCNPELGQAAHRCHFEVRIVDQGVIQFPGLAHIQKNEVLVRLQLASQFLYPDFGDFMRAHARQNPARTGRTSSEVTKASESIS